VDSDIEVVNLDKVVCQPSDSFLPGEIHEEFSYAETLEDGR
jgi:hypothetical protein